MEAFSRQSSTTSSSSYHRHNHNPLEKFCKHTSRLLRKQLISTLTNQVLEGYKKRSDTSDASDLTPQLLNAHSTIERFHGTLLFIDISGFTALSQRLDVDSLRLFINAYFKKLIDIIYRYDGDVIKFAGDALFVVWQTKVNSIGKMHLCYAGIVVCYF